MSIINIKYKHIFVHIPKCAGWSMEKTFFIGGSGHENLFFLSLHEDFNKEYFKWAFVRNPFDRLVSAYFKSRKNVLKYFNGYRYFTLQSYIYSLNDILHNDCKNEKINLDGYSIHPVPQVYFIKHDKYKLDFIGRFENLLNDWNKVCKIILGSHVGLPSMNRGNHEHYKKYYNRGMTKVVEEIYKEDFETFNY